MNITIEDIRLDVWENGFPKWFHIAQGEKTISFTLGQAPAIRDALTNLINSVKEPK